MTLLQVLSVSKSFDTTHVLRDITFHVDEGETVCLLGPSGCGKTTLLRIIAGLETVDSGQVLLDGQPLGEVPVHQRGFGLMFQDYALFPHKDVEANVAFGLRMQGLPSVQIHAAVSETLDLVGLEDYGRRRVYDLSGGEQQRVALARSLAPRPRLLMLDEPLGSLDRALREELMSELRAILRRVGVTAIYVTHDQQEAFAVADRVAIMDRGCIVQQGTPQAVYRHPASTWVAQFLGLANLLPGRAEAIASGAIQETSALMVETALGRFALKAKGGVSAGQDVTVLIHPEAARLQTDCPDEDSIPFEGIVQECSFRGGHYRLGVHHRSGQDLTFDLITEAVRLPSPGEPIALALRPTAISLLVESNS